MIRFLVSTHFTDAGLMSSLLEGMRAHAECDAFPLWIEDASVPPLLYKLLPHLKSLDDTWVLTLETHEALDTFVKILESADWAHPDFVMLAADDARKRWTMSEFHRAVFVEKEFE